MGSGNSLKCTICSTTIEVPLCCDEEMEVVNGQLKCTLCNSNKEVPICCGKENVMVTQKNS